MNHAKILISSLNLAVLVFIQANVLAYLGITILILRKQGTKGAQVHPALLNPHLLLAVTSRTTMAKTFDGPPPLERSGSEHRRAVTSFLLRKKAWLEVELPLAKGRRRNSKKLL